MIYFDVTRMGTARHRSGLTRVTLRLREEFGGVATTVSWDAGTRGFVSGKKKDPVVFTPADWLLTVELFCESERPGFWAFLKNPPCRLAVVFHDAIPLRFPRISWPQSVQRHAEYLKMLASFDRVFPVSETSRNDLAAFWRWQGTTPKGALQTIDLGADFDGELRVRRDPMIPPGRPLLLSVGIVEPRKNQALLLDVVEELWRSGLDFELHVVGRVNPFFGQPVEARMKALQKRESRFHFHAAIADRALARLYASARAVAFPTIAEGCGLPLLEALWRGVPCVCSDLPVLRENADGGGCLTARLDDVADWSAKLRMVLGDPAVNRRLQAEAMARPLPRWTDTALAIRKGM